MNKQPATIGRAKVCYVWTAISACSTTRGGRGRILAYLRNKQGPDCSKAAPPHLALRCATCRRRPCRSPSKPERAASLPSVILSARRSSARDTRPGCGPKRGARHHNNGHDGIELTQLLQGFDALFIRHENIA
jgi:hypothetical protein